MKLSASALLSSLSLLCLSVTGVAEDRSPLQLELAPTPLYMERGPDFLHIDADLLISNNSAVSYELQLIQEELLDANGQILRQRSLDGSGVQPAVRTVPNRSLAGQSRQLIVSPFPPAPAHFPVSRVRYRLDYKTVSEGDEPSSSVVVQAEASVSEYRNRTSHNLPLNGRLINFDGHDYLAHHRRWDYTIPPLRAMGFVSNQGRFAYDLVPVDSDNQQYQGQFGENASWRGFGQAVLASASGKVVALHDGMADSRSFDEAELGLRPMVIYGNYVVIDHGNGELSLYGHLKQQSLVVKLGENVRQGQTIGRIGASGSAHFPHLHYELRNAQGVAAEGLPVRFHDFVRLAGKQTPGEGPIETGELVEARRP